MIACARDSLVLEGRLDEVERITQHASGRDDAPQQVFGAFKNRR